MRNGMLSNWYNLLGNINCKSIFKFLLNGHHAFPISRGKPPKTKYNYTICLPLLISKNQLLIFCANMTANQRIRRLLIAISNFLLNIILLQNLVDNYDLAMLVISINLSSKIKYVPLYLRIIQNLKLQQLSHGTLSNFVLCKQ